MARVRVRRKRPARAQSLQDLPSLIAERPEPVRVANVTVMPSVWSDPADLTPGTARVARVISGHRHFDPLRWCQARHGDRSAITTKHILAADHLRKLADAVRYGFSGGRNPYLYVDTLHLPQLGPNLAAQRQARCWKPFVRAMRLFSSWQRRLLTAVVLLNQSVAAFCEQCAAEGKRPLARTAMGQLVQCLDLLAEHFDREISEDLNRGRIAA
jgi:hypothetical protein